MASVFLVFALLMSALGASAQPAARRAPGFSLPDMNMRQHDLQDYAGKVVLIEIMKTNCPHCRPFTTVLEQVKAKYGGRVAVLSVVHPPDDINAVKKYISENKVTFPILFDCGQMAASYLRRGTVDLPHLFIVDGKGMIQGDFSYVSNKSIFEGKELYGAIDRLLKTR